LNLSHTQYILYKYLVCKREKLAYAPWKVTGHDLETFKIEGRIITCYHRAYNFLALHKVTAYYIVMGKHTP
jgi:hypothetical protein